MNDPFGSAKFLLGVARTDFVLWFFSNRVQVPEEKLDLVILLTIMITSGTLGFLPFERHIENENPIRGASVRFFLAMTVVLIGLLILALIHHLIMPQLLQPWHLSPLRIVLATVIPWSLIGIGLYVWRRIRQS